MGRSGSSVTARVLNLLGVDLGPQETMLEAKPGDNPRGFWEQRAIMELNDEIFATYGSSWWQPNLPPGWHRSPEIAPLKEKARAILASHFDGSRLWGWKDPRNSLTVPFWQDLVPNLRYVICLRSPTESAASHHARSREEHPLENIEDTIRLWLRFNAESLLLTEGAQRIVVFYEDYFDNRSAQLARLARFVGRETSLSPSLRTEIDEFIETGLRHHRTEPEELARDNRVPLPARGFYFLLRALVTAELARGGEVDGTLTHAATEAAWRLGLTADLLSSR